MLTWNFDYVTFDGFSDHAWVYADEVAHGGPLGGFRKGWARLENQLCDWKFRPLSHTIFTWPPGRKRKSEKELNHMTNNLINHLAYWCPVKTLDTKAWLSFLVGDTHWCAKRVMHPEDEKALFGGPSQTLLDASLYWACPDLSFISKPWS